MCARVHARPVVSRACTRALVQDIFALARSSAATTKNVPILRLYPPASTLNPTRPARRLPFSLHLPPLLLLLLLALSISPSLTLSYSRLPRSCRTAQSSCDASQFYSIPFDRFANYGSLSERRCFATNLSIRSIRSVICSRVLVILEELLGNRDFTLRQCSFFQ